MEELIDKWAEILHHEDLNETKSGRISSSYQEAMQKMDSILMFAIHLIIELKHEKFLSILFTPDG